MVRNTTDPDQYNPWVDVEDSRLRSIAAHMKCCSVHAEQRPPTPSKEKELKMKPLVERKFAVSSRSRNGVNNADVWASSPISYAEAKTILVHNGWDESKADADLDECPDRWIPVNENTQIC
jgi:hypothetical protein